MADIISELAGKVGISPDTAQKGMGILLSLLKQALPADSFAKVESAVPGADRMLAAAEESGEAAGGGLLESVKGVAGKLFGGGASAALLSKLNQLGLSPEQLEKFLTHAVEVLKAKLPPDVMKKVSGLIPVAQDAPR
jgi:hypothetical protein